MTKLERSLTKVIYEQRHAKLSDVEELSDIILSIPELKIADELPFQSPEELSYCINSKKSIFLVYVKMDRIVGFLYGVLETDETACITYLGVAKEFRLQGIARSLVRKFVVEVNHFPISRIYTLATNPNAIKLFNKCGLFKKTTLTYLSNDVNEIWRVV